MKLGADVPDGAAGELEDCESPVMTGINSFLRHILSLAIS